MDRHTFGNRIAGANGQWVIEIFLVDRVEIRFRVGDRINGRPGLAVQIDTNKTEDIIQVGDVVKEFVQNYEVPGSYELIYFRDLTRRKHSEAGPT